MKHIKKFETKINPNSYKDEDLLKIQVAKLTKFFKESGILTEVTDSFDYDISYDDNNRYFFVIIEDDSDDSIFAVHYVNNGIWLSDLSKLIDMLDSMKSFIGFINKIVKKIKLEGYDDVTTTMTRIGAQIRIGISNNPEDEIIYSGV